ncbi:M48 family metallopeptidase [Pseudidiomarina aestuarii]|uniref:M48 family metallopeptidase n=1 Tax=Pseudidiomarina aestuarii TaxID=624146 RepID=UPI003A972C99
MWKSIGLAAASALLVFGCTQSPTGRSQFKLFSSDEMATLGNQSYAQIKDKEKVSSDQALIGYVQCITDDLVAVLPQPWRDLKWEVTVFDNEAVNAFALPGENIGVYTGLIDVAETPAQLAAVIGHEIGHVIAEHGNERMTSEVAAGLGLSLGAAWVGKELEGDTAAIVMASLGVGTQLLYILPYSRTHESESDQLGMDYMAAAGYDPAGAAQLWRNMAAQAGANPPEFLSTHPSPQTRIDALEAYRSEVQATYQRAISEGGRPNCVKPT